MRRDAMSEDPYRRPMRIGPSGHDRHRRTALAGDLEVMAAPPQRIANPLRFHLRAAQNGWIGGRYQQNRVPHSNYCRPLFDAIRHARIVAEARQPIGKFRRDAHQLYHQPRLNAAKVPVSFRQLDDRFVGVA